MRHTRDGVRIERPRTRRGVALAAAVVLLACGCASHAVKTPPPDVMRAAITPVATAAPDGVLRPEKYYPDQNPAFVPGGPAKPGGAGNDWDVPGLPRYDDHVAVEELPVALAHAPVVYPQAARVEGVEGTVNLNVLVDADGNVRSVRVAKSIPALDQAAKDAVMQWKFKPAMDAGKPAAAWVDVPVKFALK